MPSRYDKVRCSFISSLKIGFSAHFGGALDISVSRSLDADAWMRRSVYQLAATLVMCERPGTPSIALSKMPENPEMHSHDVVELLRMLPN